MKLVQKLRQLLGAGAGSAGDHDIARRKATNRIEEQVLIREREQARRLEIINTELQVLKRGRQ